MCKNCSKDIAVKERMYSLEEVKDYLDSLGCTLLDDEYNGVKSDLNYICKNGHYATNSLDTIKIGGNGHCSYCREEFLLNNRGANHYKWKGGVYESESRKFRTTYEFKKWRIDVFKRDNWTCQICASRSYLNAHHKDGYNWSVERRTDVSNGVTLCEVCHGEFHLKYGTGDNTEEQFNIFLHYKKSCRKLRE